jgi:hypothetical protein
MLQAIDQLQLIRTERRKTVYIATSRWTSPLARGPKALVATGLARGWRPLGYSGETARPISTFDKDYEASSINLIALRVRTPFGDLSSSIPV